MQESNGHLKINEIMAAIESELEASGHGEELVSVILCAFVIGYDVGYDVGYRIARAEELERVTK